MSLPGIGNNQVSFAGFPHCGISMSNTAMSRGLIAINYKANGIGKKMRAHKVGPHQFT